MAVEKRMYVVDRYVNFVLLVICEKVEWVIWCMMDFYLSACFSMYTETQKCIDFASLSKCLYMADESTFLFEDTWLVSAHVSWTRLQRSFFLTCDNLNVFAVHVRGQVMFSVVLVCLCLNLERRLLCQLSHSYKKH